jgi:hypothetical protein
MYNAVANHLNFLRIVNHPGLLINQQLYGFFQAGIMIKQFGCMLYDLFFRTVKNLVRYYSILETDPFYQAAADGLVERHLKQLVFKGAAA